MLDSLPELKVKQRTTSPMLLDLQSLAFSERPEPPQATKAAGGDAMYAVGEVGQCHGLYLLGCLGHQAI